jgi:hypothetical protein
VSGISAWVVMGPVAVAAIGAVSAFVQGRQNARKITEIHVLVNSQLAAVIARVAQLRGTLEDAGVDVPEAPGETGGS